MPKNSGKILIIMLLFLLAGVLALKQKAAFGWAFDFLLVVLLIAPIFLDLGEFLFFEVFGIWFLRLIYPFSGLETVILALLPLFSFGFRRFLHWQSWAEPFAISFFGVLGFYACVSPAIFGNLSFLFLDLSASLAFAWVLYAVLNRAWKPKY
ncbi:MAG: hypothetical protein Q7S36_02440 [Candidatus Liptonbacteria bacterium]|nr:hypothetical protein [Candidatus Liptonbacteria bacterium]